MIWISSDRGLFYRKHLSSHICYCTDVKLCPLVSTSRLFVFSIGIIYRNNKCFCWWLYLITVLRICQYYFWFIFIFLDFSFVVILNFVYIYYTFRNFLFFWTRRVFLPLLKILFPYVKINSKLSHGAQQERSCSHVFTGRGLIRRWTGTIFQLFMHITIQKSSPRPVFRRWPCLRTAFSGFPFTITISTIHGRMRGRSLPRRRENIPSFSTKTISSTRRFPPGSWNVSKSPTPSLQCRRLSFQR